MRSFQHTMFDYQRILLWVKFVSTLPQKWRAKIGILHDFPGDNSLIFLGANPMPQTIPVTLVTHDFFEGHSTIIPGIWGWNISLGLPDEKPACAHIYLLVINHFWSSTRAMTNPPFTDDFPSNMGWCLMTGGQLQPFPGNPREFPSLLGVFRFLWVPPLRTWLNHIYIRNHHFRQVAKRLTQCSSVTWCPLPGGARTAPSVQNSFCGSTCSTAQGGGGSFNLGNL